MPEREKPTTGSIFKPPVFEDEVRSDTAWVLHWLVWSVAGLVTALILIMIPVVGEKPLRFLGQAATVDALCLGMLLLIRRGRLELAQRLLVTGMWLIAVATVWTSDGLESPAIATFLLAVAYMVLFFDRRLGMLSTVLAATAFFGFAIVEVTGILPEPSVVHTPWSRAIGMTIYALILVGALFLVARTLDRSRARTERELLDRRAAEAEARALAAELEDRVEERTAALVSVVDDLEGANQQLAAATRAKTDFLAAMSHELRTPLNSVIGFSGTLSGGLAGPLNEEQQRQVEMIGTSGRILLDLVNQVLDLAKIEAGDLEVALSEVDVAAAVRRVVNLASPLAADAGLVLTGEVDEDVGTMTSDRLRIEQALLNLLGNAIKFTESGTVALDVYADGDAVVFRVVDTGPGIPADELSMVFERFYQAPPAGGGKHEGTGLGLSLTQQLVESLGGTISATSTIGVGSTFRIRLPRTAPTPE